MSKSLKNFITIQEALQTHSPRQIRFCFLLSRYNAPMVRKEGGRKGGREGEGLEERVLWQWY
jgi:hypothetical protein